MYFSAQNWVYNQEMYNCPTQMCTAYKCTTVLHGFMDQLDRTKINWEELFKWITSKYLKYLSDIILSVGISDLKYFLKYFIDRSYRQIDFDIYYVITCNNACRPFEKGPVNGPKSFRDRCNVCKAWTVIKISNYLTCLIQ